MCIIINFQKSWDLYSDSIRNTFSPTMRKLFHVTPNVFGKKLGLIKFLQLLNTDTGNFPGGEGAIGFVNHGRFEFKYYRCIGSMLKSTKMLDDWHNNHTKQNNLEKKN